MDFSSIDSATVMALVFCLTLAWTSWQAHRLGNEGRDVRLLGSGAALSGLGAGLFALL